jgi:hypothetical protein
MPTALLDANRTSAHASKPRLLLPSRMLASSHHRQRASVHAPLPLRHPPVSLCLQMLDADQVSEERHALGRSGVTAAANSKFMKTLDWSILTNLWQAPTVAPQLVSDS